jgi:hypothetical protein
LPRGKLDIGAATHHIRILADMPHELVRRALDALETEWRNRGWDRFSAYFVSTWVNNMTLWWSGSLGPGTPRTTGGTEGKWPVIHRLFRGHRKLQPQRLVEGLSSTVLPYLFNQQTVRFSRKLEDHPAAIELALCTRIKSYVDRPCFGLARRGFLVMGVLVSRSRK